MTRPRSTRSHPAELVIDHSVIADVFGTADSFARNVEIEYERNVERYQFLRWGQRAFDDFKVVPPGTGIVHQVNLEYLARVVFTREATATRAYPDTCVGTDSHTTMVNGLGVIGWGVGGIEAEAAMLGQPVSMLIPRVVGFKLSGELPEGVTATDLVLTITEMLRKHGVVGKFVEFYGSGVRGAAGRTGRRSATCRRSTARPSRSSRWTTRRSATSGSPAGRTASSRSSRRTRRSRASGTTPTRASLLEYLELDLATIVPSIAGPKRPQDRVALSDAKAGFRSVLGEYVGEPEEQDEQGYDRASASRSRPATRPPTPARTSSAPPHERAAGGTGGADPAGDRVSKPTPVTLADGTMFELDHGAVAIAAITSCTNTSNPSVMLGAALLAKNAVDKGMTSKPWVKTSSRPVRRWSWTTTSGPASRRTWRSWASTWWDTGARRASAIPPAHPRGQQGRRGRRPGRGVCAVRQPELRGPDQRRGEDELSRLAAAGGGLRAGGVDGRRPAQ